jgi:tRNA modification GTPase
MREALVQIDILTPPGRGAVAVIACTGDISILDGDHESPPLCIARDGRLFQGRPINRVTFARWGGDHPEDVVVCRTSENEFEVHCHGGRAAVERIRKELTAALGSTTPRLRQSTANEEHHRLLAAAWHAVSLATTLRTADLLLHQAAEAWPAFLEWQGQASAEPQPANDSPPSTTRRQTTEHRDQLAWAHFGLRLTQPRTVALVGEPNAGKSSLMNALAGFQRSIVNPIPGTTRDAVTLDVAFDGWPIRLIDTAGLRDSADELESAGIDRARRVINDADLILHIFDATQPQPDTINRAIPVANKTDLRPDSTWPENIMPVSALTGAGIDQLIERIVSTLIPELPPRELAIPISPLHLTWLKSKP